MGRSVSYPSGARVVTFKHFDDTVECEVCDGDGHYDEDGETIDCVECGGSGEALCEPDADDIIEDFRSHLKHLFPSVESADDWIGREDHVLAENKLARFGISEYCGLVAYWIVPRSFNEYYGDTDPSPLSERWVDNIADKFVAAFGELTKVGSMSNGEGVYRQIRKD